jgi:hypothetical protein
MGAVAKSRALAIKTSFAFKANVSVFLALVRRMVTAGKSTMGAVKRWTAAAARATAALMECASAFRMNVPQAAAASSTTVAKPSIAAAPLGTSATRTANAFATQRNVRT